MFSNQFGYSQTNIDNNLGYECSNLGDVFNGIWTIEYPSWIELNEPAEISLFFKPGSLVDEYNGDSCQLIVETYLEIPSIKIEPGERIYSPLPNNSNIYFKWNIHPHNQEISGKIWIYISAINSNGDKIRIPLFAIPIEMKVVSIVSVSPKLIRGLIFISACIMMGISTLLNRRYKLK